MIVNNHYECCNLHAWLPVLFVHRSSYDVLAEHSAVDLSILRPAQRLQWNISSETARDIDTAKRNFDRFGKSILKFIHRHLKGSHEANTCEHA